MSRQGIPSARRLPTGSRRVTVAAVAAAFAPLLCVPQARAQSGPSATLQTALDGGLDFVETRRASSENDELVLRLSPGIHFNSRSGFVQGSLSYRGDALVRVGESGNSELRHALNAALRANLIENRLVVDTSASVSRLALSPFGVQSASNSALDNANAQDFGQLSLRPRLLGQIGGALSYDLSAFTSISRTRHSDIGDATERGAAAALGSAGAGRLGWGLNVQQSTTEYRGGARPIESGRVIGSLSLQPDVDWRLFLRGGQESTNAASINERRYDNWGAGVHWTPSPRTAVRADADRRYFGNSWQLSVEHRLPRSALRISSSRDASTNTGGGGQPITLYDLFFALFASEQPDPVLRDAMVREYLRITERDPATTVSGGFVPGGATITSRTDIGWTYAGARLMLALQAFATSMRTLADTGPAVTQDTVSQRAYLASASWRLSPTASISLAGSEQITADTPTQAGNRLRSASLALTEQIGLRTAASVSARYSVMRGGPDPYRESSLGATLSHRF